MNQTDDHLTREEAVRLHEVLLRKARSKRRVNHVARYAGVAASVLLIVAALAWSLGRLAPLGNGAADNPTPPPSTEADTYRMEYLGTYGAETSPGTSAISVRFSWSGDAYPGVRDCEIRALGQDGEVVGTRSIQISLAPEHSQTSGIEIKTSGPATDASGSCGPRLDIGDPYEYGIDQRTPTASNGGINIFAVVHWLGQGQPGVVHCRVSALDEAGDVIATTTSVQDGTSQTWQIRIEPSDVPTIPAGRLSSLIRCVPYVDGKESLPTIDSVDLAAPIDFPYESPPGTGYAFSDVVFRDTPSGWVATYDMSWESGVYPGDRQCTVVVKDASGEIVGREESEYGSLAPDPHANELPATEQPVSFEGTCGDRLDTPVAYEISNVQRSGTDISFDLAWPSDLPQGSYPGTNQCIAGYVQGTTVVALGEPFTMSVPDGHYDTALHDPSGDPGMPVVRCEPYSGDLDGLRERFRAQVGA